MSFSEACEQLSDMLSFCENTDELPAYMALMIPPYFKSILKGGSDPVCVRPPAQTQRHVPTPTASAPWRLHLILRPDTECPRAHLIQVPTVRTRRCLQHC